MTSWAQRAAGGTVSETWKIVGVPEVLDACRGWVSTSTLARPRDARSSARDEWDQAHLAHGCADEGSQVVGLLGGAGPRPLEMADQGQRGRNLMQLCRSWQRDGVRCRGGRAAWGGGTQVQHGGNIAPDELQRVFVATRLDEGRALEGWG